MIARAIAASVPFKWVAGDTVYGVGDIEQQLRRAGTLVSYQINRQLSGWNLLH
jgi:SRSO17 transposase